MPPHRTSLVATKPCLPSLCLHLGPHLSNLLSLPPGAIAGFKLKSCTVGGNPPPPPTGGCWHGPLHSVYAPSFRGSGVDGPLYQRYKEHAWEYCCHWETESFSEAMQIITQTTTNADSVVNCCNMIVQNKYTGVFFGGLGLYGNDDLNAVKGGLGLAGVSTIDLRKKTGSAELRTYDDYTFWIYHWVGDSFGGGTGCLPGLGNAPASGAATNDVKEVEGVQYEVRPP